MEIFIYTYLFFIGAILASFYGVLATRLLNNESIIKPKSHCNDCKHSLKWYDLIPVFSFVTTLGRCRYCKKKIPVFYPISELSLGILFCISYRIYGPNISYEFLVSLILFSLNMIIFISDFNYFIILDSPLVFSIITIFILKLIFFGLKPAILAFISGIILFLIMLLVKKMGDIMFKRESLGGGDIKLALVIGIVLGVRLGLCALILSTFLALPYALLRVSLSKEKEVPFGPFIISACTIVFLFMPKFINLLSFLFN